MKIANQSKIKQEICFIKPSTLLFISMAVSTDPYINGVISKNNEHGISFQSFHYWL